MTGRPVLLVVYDAGSLAPTRLAEVARRNGCDLLFAMADTAHAREMKATLEMYGAVVDLAGLSEVDAVDAVRRFDPAGIVTFSEFQIATTVALAHGLGLDYHSPDDLRAITHKDAQRERFVRAGVDQIRTRTVTRPDQVDEAVAHVGLPAIVKPVLGASSRNTTAVRTVDECRRTLESVLAAEDAVMLEELLVGKPVPAPWGDYIAVDCVASGSDVRPVFVTSKFALAEPFRERGGYGGRSVEPASEVSRVCDVACAAVRALNIHGVADVEIKLTPSGPRVIEVNGRLGAWVDDLAVRSGTADPADVAVKAALGRDYGASCMRPDDAADHDPIVFHDDVAEQHPLAFHYLVAPPTGVQRVRAIRNVAALRRVPRVDRVAVLTRPGADASWRIGSAANVAAVLGTARDHDELARTVAAIEDVDWIDYE